MGEGGLCLVLRQELQGKAARGLLPKCGWPCSCLERLSQSKERAADAGLDGAERVARSSRRFRCASGPRRMPSPEFCAARREAGGWPRGRAPSGCCVRLLRQGCRRRARFISSTISVGRRRRMTSMERLRATTASQPPREPRVAMNCSGCRQICMKISCRMSSAAGTSRSTRRATE